jgi:YbbR domain-containing protein
MDKFLGNNTILRIVALVLACMLWLVVNEPDAGSTGDNLGQPPVTVNIEHRLTSQQTVHVNVVGAPAPGYTVGTPSVNFPYVEISGTKSAIDKVAEVIGVVDVQGATQSVTETVRLSAVDNSGRIVQDVRVSPNTAVVTVPVQSPKVIASVIPQITGSPVGGFVVSGVDIRPDFVVISGSPQVVTSLQNVNIPIDVTGLKKSKKFHVTLPNINGVTKIEPQTLTVQVHVEPSMTRYFPDIPVNIRSTVSGRHPSLVSPKTIGVTVSGPETIVKTLTRADLAAVVDVDSITTDETSAPITVMAPNWTQITRLTAARATIQWK